MILLRLCLLLTLTLLTRYSGAVSEPLKPVVVQIKWHHQFQFAGFYAAKELGYYQDVGLDVTIKERDVKHTVLDQVLSGQAQYGVADSTLVLHRLKGLPVVALLASYQYSPLVLITRAKDNILNPIQLKNKRVMYGLNSDDSTLLALFKQFDLTIEDYQFVKVADPRSALENNEIDAYAGYITNQPYLHQESGLAVNIINPSNYGIDFIGDFVFTTEAYLALNSTEVAEFKQATIKGWQYALTNPEQVIDWIIHVYRAQRSLGALQNEARMSRRFFDQDLTKLGQIPQQRLQQSAQLYRDLNMVPNQSRLKGFQLMVQTKPSLVDWRIVALSLLMFTVLMSLLFRLRRKITAGLNKISALFSKTALLEAQYQHQIDQNILSYRTDKNDCFVFVSPAFCAKIGYLEHELIGQPRSAYYHPEYPSSAAIKISKSILSHLSWSGEIMYKNKRGDLYWHRAQLEPIVKNDYLLGYSSIEYDISDKKRIEQAAVIDPTTGLFNRFKIEQLLKYEYNRSSRTNLPFSVILLNFSGIELVRTKEGEQALDEMLLSLANIVNCEIRLSDTAGRWKAEQLLIICPETTSNGAKLLAAKISRSIERYTFSSAIVPRVLISADRLAKREDVSQLVERLESKLASANQGH